MRPYSFIYVNALPEDESVLLNKARIKAKAIALNIDETIRDLPEVSLYFESLMRSRS